MKVLILYSELAGYTVNCMQHTLKVYPELELHVVRWPVNKEAPFELNFENIHVYQKEDYPLSELMNLVRRISPQMIMCSGWMDKDYVHVCKQFVQKIPVTLTLDNHWRGDLKQIMASKLSKFLIRSKFNQVWVPGEKQYRFAKKLGFKDGKIKKGFYSADTQRFREYGKKFSQRKQKEMPKRLLYVGRYVKHKGIFDLWEAFNMVSNRFSDWELICVGTGDQWVNRLDHPKIKHMGFLQPDEFEDVIRDTSIYILPSHFEPWGVSVHEFAAAGYPMVLSDAIGASEQFCDEKNGIVFKSKDVVGLSSALETIMKLSQERYNDMCNHSINLSLSITPGGWAKTFYDLANAKN